MSDLLKELRQLRTDAQHEAQENQKKSAQEYEDNLKKSRESGEKRGLALVSDLIEEMRKVAKDPKKPSVAEVEVGSSHDYAVADAAANVLMREMVSRGFPSVERYSNSHAREPSDDGYPGMDAYTSYHVSVKW